MYGPICMNSTLFYDVNSCILRWKELFNWYSKRWESYNWIEMSEHLMGWTGITRITCMIIGNKVGFITGNCGKLDIYRRCRSFEILGLFAICVRSHLQGIILIQAYSLIHQSCDPFWFFKNHSEAVKKSLPAFSMTQKPNVILFKLESFRQSAMSRFIKNYPFKKCSKIIAHDL